MNYKISQENKIFTKKLILNIFFIIASSFLFIFFIFLCSETSLGYGFIDDILCLLCWTGAFLTPILTIFEIVRLIILLTKKYRNSAKYQEKCYKRINRIHIYYENGSITEEEFNQLKQKILNKIGK